jgi:hypothetical protein
MDGHSTEYYCRKHLSLFLIVLIWGRERMCYLNTNFISKFHTITISVTGDLKCFIYKTECLRKTGQCSYCRRSQYRSF